LELIIEGAMQVSVIMILDKKMRSFEAMTNECVYIYTIIQIFLKERQLRLPCHNIVPVSLK
jgi:hypothetical protein